MPADIESLDAARQARYADQHASEAALRYIRRAEDAFALLPTIQAGTDRTTVFQITETWLKLAEAALRSPARSR